MSWTVAAISTLVGVPIGSALIKRRGGSKGTEGLDFLGLQIWGATALLIGAVLLIVTWVGVVRRNKSSIWI